jgi:hypothetical protein
MYSFSWQWTCNSSFLGSVRFTCGHILCSVTFVHASQTPLMLLEGSACTVQKKLGCCRSLGLILPTQTSVEQVCRCPIQHLQTCSTDVDWTDVRCSVIRVLMWMYPGLHSWLHFWS